MSDNIPRKPHPPLPALEPAKAGPAPEYKGQFSPGQSGNPKGRPQGSKNKATLAALALLEGDLEIITGKLVEKAKAGESWAIKLILDKLLPNAKDRPITFRLPKLEKTGDLRSALESLLETISQGELTPAEGQPIVKIINDIVLTHNIEALERRVEDLEELGRLCK